MATRVPSEHGSVRKAPRQLRSRATVDTIVEAAARVLARRGWAHFTTNETASAAGVSVGSIYQYFPNKLALAEEIRKRHLDAVLAAISGSDERDAVITVEQRAAKLVDGVVAAHSVDQELHRVLLDEVPLAARSTQDQFEAEYLRRYQAVIASAPGKPDPKRDDIAGRVLSGAVEGVVHAAARHGELQSPELRAELIELVCAYLRSRCTG
ncbi:TetR/AcrR family transcriptional regulator [Mesorhizobium sp. M7A.T.Ca.TU.009.02.1.1]|nr:TetR/AcrR family transcriptional regulator [Mesorhizobium sp. M7A.T.Ca.US.000.02.1.1]RUT90426.1 TetR/AcrR family transcriptional regulator [Mesorhizobium sp. M7A.T.Ca.US.000.02.2.1]RUT97591.1 TetR/AcrR family transcriptional regulator [Mesorhizobium sp. M7A.T.Ca.TU.009.02.1.1]RUU54059.1 TetR/AcrR family transcriptional regulator [Mesorhizobium sp. M7A.T.Ca.TU.009.01.1.1]RUU73378.1 TetR/AcrR family transcriptional regulator [Mesorhizobium sp. M7A.T.Ca.TU.009.01.1.2]RUV19590.1 TetR/AcrR famil